jgi:hypothetical protein
MPRWNVGYAQAVLRSVAIGTWACTATDSASIISPPAWPGGGGAGQHAAVPVGDQLDEAVVPRAVDEAAGGRRQRGVADLHVDAGVAGLLLRHADRADLRADENDARAGGAAGGDQELRG